MLITCTGWRSTLAATTWVNQILAAASPRPTPRPGRQQAERFQHEGRESVNQWRRGRKNGFPIYLGPEATKQQSQMWPAAAVACSCISRSSGSCRKPSTASSDDLRAILFDEHHGLIDAAVEEIGCIAGERPVLGARRTHGRFEMRPRPCRGRDNVENAVRRLASTL